MERSASSMYGWVGPDSGSTEEQKMSEMRTMEPGGNATSNSEEAKPHAERARQSGMKQWHWQNQRLTAQYHQQRRVIKQWNQKDVWEWEICIQQRRSIWVIKQQNQQGTECTTDIGKYHPSGIAVQQRSIRELETACYRCRMEQKWNEASDWNGKKSASNVIAGSISG
jgi:hypothetical protein